MIPQPSDIHYFQVVCETLNLTRASERLGVVQPTLSGALRRLEEAVGKPLFIRSSHGLTLTRVGEEFQLRTKILLQDWERITKSLSDLDRVPSGKFILGCHPSVGLYSLNHFMKDILSSPMLELSLIHASSRELTEMIISRKVDLGLVINPLKQNDLVLKKLCTDRVGFWFTSKSNLDVLIYDNNLSQGQKLLKKGLTFSRVMNSSNLEVIADLCSSGCGVAILPERVAKRFNGLQPFSDDWVSDELFLAYRADISKTAGFRFITQSILKSKI
jgi:DNA-binding transcriptional LysR family regulator